MAENFLKLAGLEERTPPAGRMTRSFHRLCELDQSMRRLWKIKNYAIKPRNASL